MAFRLGDLLRAARLPAMAIGCGLGGWLVARDSFAGVVIMTAALALLGVILGEQVVLARLAERMLGRPAGSLREVMTLAAARLEALDHRAAHAHPVTGLPTREPLCETIAADVAAERASSASPRLLGAIRFVDFDRLAGFDHALANCALEQFARRLVAVTQAGRMVAQVDRDCFAVWFGAADLEAARAEFQAIAYVAGHEMEIDGGRLTPTIEISAVSLPQEGQDGLALLLRATAALARPEGGEGGEIRLQALQPVEAAREQFMLEQDLAQAIAEDQLTMVFQPVVDLAAGRMMGAEALLRWDHPILGPVSPARFIPVVEALGLSERYGLWVLNTACREARRWADEGFGGMRVAVNLSARQLLDPGLKTKIERTLARHGLGAEALELELTETATMADAERTYQLFGDLRAMGVSLAVDDFGSGYSSLSYLKNLPFDKLKIDREFVAQIDQRRDSRAICRALIELGRGLDLLVLAEGVETEAEVACLRALGCHVFQGYHFSKPLSGRDFLALAADPSWRSRLNVAAQRPPNLHTANRHAEELTL
ncbi:bifunctional diguanylate cyclase/phosphodiesterase [Phenylobacterium sp.]|uniref:putative bifunctional diguanylate cyclase/phosphodiesterase n=1 Tax=Phenylobacterium sp. TaxID=1871053 RepID=UPI0027320CF8|nr:bifunctional diguanylate cyclase/phosphodiesterase [Phenylobacterium sp.]MDP1617397.1 bifunctional diguanylate cyclase/phosphodiesterase [Phenylobacterium sp.]MDP1988745.1 bifunctional diguanylate cyclase/phosphodiesterase [Phenylobacterium sp.]